MQRFTLAAPKIAAALDDWRRSETFGDDLATSGDGRADPSHRSHPYSGLPRADKGLAGMSTAESSTGSMSEGRVAADMDAGRRSAPMRDRDVQPQERRREPQPSAR